MSYFDLTSSLLSWDERQKIRDDPVLNDLHSQLEAIQQELNNLESALEQE